MFRGIACAGLLAALLAAAPAGAMVRLPAPLSAVPGNPADRLAAVPIDAMRYDPATHCTAKPKPGMTDLVQWMQTHARGVWWGSYRCEKWGRHSASLHAEGRALDWHLDVTDPADKAEAQRLILLFVAPDSAGNPQALARRMGIEELIWDCGYWAIGMTEFQRYQACYDKHGKRRRHVDPTIGHRNHIHIGLNQAGAMARTSFWTAQPARR